MEYIIGIDIGGTTSRVSLGQINEDTFNIIKQSDIFNTQSYSPKELISCFIKFIYKIQEDYSVKAIGISSGGPLDSKKGTILSPPNLPGWDNIKIVETIESQVKIPTYLCNDANAGALAEWLFGAGRGSSNMIFLTFGTGMGSGLILDGKLYSGTNDMAGEVGHVRLAPFGPSGYGKIGSFEGFCSGCGIAQYAQIKAIEQNQLGTLPSWIEDIQQLSAKDIGVMASKGDPFALTIMNEISVNLGKGLSILIDILNPEKIVVGSIYQRNESLMKKIVQETIEKESLALSSAVCTIHASELNESIGDISALTVGYYFGVKRNEN